LVLKLDPGAEAVVDVQYWRIEYALVGMALCGECNVDLPVAVARSARIVGDERRPSLRGAQKWEHGKNQKANSLREPDTHGAESR
jgi:hypothetical protein